MIQNEWPDIVVRAVQRAPRAGRIADWRLPTRDSVPAAIVLRCLCLTIKEHAGYALLIMEEHFYPYRVGINSNLITNAKPSSAGGQEL
jgi:hypothetical protein